MLKVLTWEGKIQRLLEMNLKNMKVNEDEMKKLDTI